MLYKIIQGDKIGQEIGFPTINLSPSELDAKFDFGVYFCEVFFLHNKKHYSGIMHYGPKKTFDEEKISLEVHLFDFNQDVYGEKVKLKVGKKIRDIYKFENKKELKTQIKKDVKIVKGLQIKQK